VQSPARKEKCTIGIEGGGTGDEGKCSARLAIEGPAGGMEGD